jgi:polygalacturonase
MRDPRSFGAVGDGAHADGPAIQAAIDAAAAEGGGSVVVGPGSWLAGALVMRSNVELVVEAGATLLASEDPADYPVFEARWEGSTRPAHAPFISGTGLSRIALRGGGVIDGRGQGWWKAFRDGSLSAPRPRLVSFTDCRDVLIEGLTLMNSPSWTVNPVRCRNLRVKGVTIRNPADSPNTDGINPDSCSSVIIEGCFISVGDDCITLKSGTELESPELRAPGEDIVVANCVMEAGHGGIVIGSEMSGGIRNVVVSNCVMRGTDRGIRIKSRRGRGGVVENVRVTNLVMEGVRCPLAINLRYHCGGAQGNPVVADLKARPMDAGTPLVRRVSLSGITARGAASAAAWIDGLAEAPVEDLHLSDVSIELAPDAAKLPPEAPEMADGVLPVAGRGFIARNVRGLRLENVEIRGQEGPAFVLEACERN